MKLRTVGTLAALGMSLTSLTVWSVGGNSATTAGPPRENSWHAPNTLVRDGAPRASFATEGTLHVAARLGHSRLPDDSTTETFVLVNVRADANAVGRPTRRHLAIAIDRSGSMRGKRLANAVAAAQGAVARLADGDSVSVIDYANTAHVLVPPTELDPDTRERVSDALGALKAGGETCISCALVTTAELVRERSDAVARVLLLSDGQATAGVLDVPGMARLADSVRAAGASVTTIGVDVDYNERMMTAIAQATNGRHYFVDSPEGLPAIFARELAGLERSVARKTNVELELAPGVELVALLDRGFSHEGSHITVPLGSFAAGEERSVLARVRVTTGNGSHQPVASARVRYDDLALGKSCDDGGELVALVSRDGSRAPLDPEVAEHLARSSTVSALKAANELFQAGNAPAARARVARKLDEVRRGHVFAVDAALEPKKAALAAAFDEQEAALGAAATAFDEPPPRFAASPAEVRRSKAAIKTNAERAAELAF